MSTRRSSGLHVGPGLSRVWWGFFPEYVGFFPGNIFVHSCVLHCIVPFSVAFQTRCIS